MQKGRCQKGTELDEAGEKGDDQAAVFEIDLLNHILYGREEEFAAIGTADQVDVVGASL